MGDDNGLRPPWPSAMEIACGTACAVGAAALVYTAVMLADHLTWASFARGGFVTVIFMLGTPIVLAWLSARAAWRLLTGRRQRWRASSRVRRQRCGRCGYDLRGGVKTEGFARCPECGEPIPEAPDRLAARLQALSLGPSKLAVPPEAAQDVAIPIASVADQAAIPDSATPAQLEPLAVAYYEPPPRPPAPPATDLIAGSFSLLLALFLTFATMGGAVAALSSGRVGETLAIIVGVAVCPGVPAVTLYYAAWRTLTRARRDWRNSVRTRRKLCIRCGFDVRRAIDDRCPNCGCDVPESIERTAARLERMSKGFASAPTQPADGAADVP